MESQELADLAEELSPYTKNYLVNMVTILDESDTIRMGKWSDKTLSERYFENLAHLREAEPKRDYSKKADEIEKVTNIEGS